MREHPVPKIEPPLIEHGFIQVEPFTTYNASTVTTTIGTGGCTYIPASNDPPVDDIDLLIDEFSMANGHINFLHQVIEDLREEIADNVESREEYEKEALDWHLANINSQSEVTQLKSEAVSLNLFNDLQVIENGRLREQLEIANDKLIDKVFQERISNAESKDELAKAWDLFREKVADLSKDNSRKKLDMMYQLEEDLELLSMDYVEEYESIRDQYQPSRNAEGAE